MDNVYLEQMVRRESTPVDLLKRIGLILGVLLLNTIVLVLFAAGFPIVLAVSCWFAFILWKRISREYEYIYTDGLLDVDCIYSRSNRRPMVSIDCKEFEVIAQAGNEQFKHEFEKRYDKFLDAGRGGIRENTWIAICNREGKTLKLYFEPKDEMLDAMKKYAPRVVALPGQIRR